MEGQTLVEFTPTMLDGIIGKLKDTLENEATQKSKVEKKKHLKEFEEH